jgi:GNAT superfamily N-acetyltransferase
LPHLGGVTTEFIASVEGAEAETMFAYENPPSPSPELRARLGLAATRIGGGVVLSMRHDPSNYWEQGPRVRVHRADQPGPDRPDHRLLPVSGHADRGHPDRARGAPAGLGGHPDRVRPGAGRILGQARGTGRGGPPARGTRLRVAPVEPEHRDEWARVLLRGFGMPAEGLDQMISEAVRNPAFRPYGVWDGSDLVGVGNLFIHGAVAALSAGAVLPEHRNQGAQSALINARAEAARAAGCRWLVAETGKPGPSAKNPSLDNLVRAGLTIRYARPNWRWRA